MGEGEETNEGLGAAPSWVGAVMLGSQKEGEGFDRAGQGWKNQWNC